MAQKKAKTQTNICSVESCTKKPVARTLCWTHYQRNRRYGDVNVVKKAIVHDRPECCTVPECTREHNALGFCILHYSRYKTHGSALWEPKVKVCSVEGCEREYESNGFCSPHLYRFQRYGNPNTSQRAFVPHVAHGLSKTAEYRVWVSMIHRCHSSSDQAYKDYGGRGIVVCDRWRLGEDGKSGAQCFLEDMGSRPSDEHTLDRRDTNGNYSPENCRWATWGEQACNRRLRIDNTSGFTGVHWNKKDREWTVAARENYRYRHLGNFDSKIEAAIAYDRWVIAHRDEYARTNFPRNYYQNDVAEEKAA